MLVLFITALGVSLEALLLVRGLQEKLVRQFPIFYFYLFLVFVTDLLRFCFYRWYSSAYPPVYWTTQFISLVVGSAVIFEIYRVGLRAFPGAARMARNALLLVFAAIFAKAMASSSGGLLWWLSTKLEELERNLRIVQAAAIVTLVLLFLIYAIPFGRNLKGILFGYGLFIAMSVSQLTLIFYSGGIVRRYWSYFQPISYLIVLAIWTSALWSRHAVPESATMRLENDYEALVASTGTQLRRVRARLGWAVRS